MFENLSERLSGVFDRLTKQGALSEADVATALREVRVALLEADVSLPVAREFVKAVQEKATGQAVTKSVTPGQQVVKIVHDELVHVLEGEGDPGALKIDNEFHWVEFEDIDRLLPAQDSLAGVIWGIQIGYVMRF